jgi:hypothetical protein
MDRKLNRLSAVEVKGVNAKGMYHDGGGLYLQVSAGGAKSWIYRFMLDGRAREMGLGPVNTIPLAEARKRAAECRKMRLDGIDPIEARWAQRGQRKLEAAKAMTFDKCAAAYIEAHKASWRNGKHAEQWRGSLRNYASPVFGSSPVQAIDLALVMKALEPIWKTKSETASRLRGRIEAVLDWAKVREYRNGENRHAGAAISTSCFRRALRSRKSSTTPPCPTTKLPSSPMCCGARRESPRAPWSF